MKKNTTPYVHGLYGIGVVIVVVLIIALFVATSKNNRKLVSYPPAKFDAAVMGHSGASIDSERQFPPNEQWRGQRSKCLDCEEDMKARCGNAAVFNATKQKLFSI
jgi:hypothetical protein